MADTSTRTRDVCQFVDGIIQTWKCQGLRLLHQALSWAVLLPPGKNWAEKLSALKLEITLQFLATGDSQKCPSCGFRVAHSTIRPFVPQLKEYMIYLYVAPLHHVLTSLHQAQGYAYAHRHICKSANLQTSLLQVPDASTHSCTSALRTSHLHFASLYLQLANTSCTSHICTYSVLFTMTFHGFQSSGYNVLMLCFLHFLGLMQRSDWSETGSTSLLQLQTNVTILNTTKNLQKKNFKILIPIICATFIAQIIVHLIHCGTPAPSPAPSTSFCHKFHRLQGGGGGFIYDEYQNYQIYWWSLS